MPAHLSFFPPEIIELNREIANHPDLMEKLYDLGPNSDWLVKLLRVATWCKIAMHGDYNEEDIRKIAIMCTHRLIESRTVMVHPTILH